jgi:hypothetical protein
LRALRERTIHAAGERPRSAVKDGMMRFDAYPEFGRGIKLFPWWKIARSPCGMRTKCEIGRRRRRRAAMNKN